MTNASPDTRDIDYGRLLCAWEDKTDYDASWLSQPWEDADETASNSIGAGWACLIGRAILVERQDGVHVGYIHGSKGEAAQMWTSYRTAYSDPREFTATVTIHFTADDEDHAEQRANAYGAQLEQNDGVRSASATFEEVS